MKLHWHKQIYSTYYKIFIIRDMQIYMKVRILLLVAIRYYEISWQAQQYVLGCKTLIIILINAYAINKSVHMQNLLGVSQ